MNKKVLVLLSVVIFILVAGASYLFFSKHASTSEEQAANTNPSNLGTVNNDYGALEFNPNLPKTETCPLTGVKYGQDQEQWWETHRPLGVMIENEIDARP